MPCNLAGIVEVLKTEGLLGPTPSWALTLLPGVSPRPEDVSPYFGVSNTSKNLEIEIVCFLSFFLFAK